MIIRKYPADHPDCPSCKELLTRLSNGRERQSTSRAVERSPCPFFLHHSDTDIEGDSCLWLGKLRILLVQVHSSVSAMKATEIQGHVIHLSCKALRKSSLGAEELGTENANTVKRAQWAEALANKPENRVPPWSPRGEEN